MAWSDAARAAAREARQRKLAAMTPSAINKRLDRLMVKSSKATQKMIDVGRGHETAWDTLKRTDPLSMHYRYLASRQAELRTEIARRYGPGAPYRMPIKFRNAPRRK